MVKLWGENHGRPGGANLSRAEYTHLPKSQWVETQCLYCAGKLAQTIPKKNFKNSKDRHPSTLDFSLKRSNIFVNIHQICTYLKPFYPSHKVASLKKSKG